MAYWSKFYTDGEIIGYDVAAGVVIKIAMENNIAFAMLQQTATGIVMAASVQRLEDVYLGNDVTFIPSFNLSDVDMLARDNGMTALFNGGFIQGAYLGNNLVLGNWYNRGFTGMEVPGWLERLKQLSSWKPGVSFNDLRPVRNELVLTVDAIDGLVSREGLVYKMEIRKPIFPGSATTKVLVILEGTEAPARIENGVTYLDGWQPEIGWYLDAEMDWTLPSEVYSEIMVQSKAVTRFTITTWAEQNNVEVVGSRSVTYTLWGIKARINEEDFASWRTRIFSKYIGETGKWLTWQPNNMQVDKDTPVYLSFLLNRNPTPAIVKVVVQVFGSLGYYFFTYAELQGLSENSLLNIPMGFNQLGLDKINDPEYPEFEAVGFDENTITGYTVWLVDETLRRISRKRTFKIDDTRKRNIRNLVINNSLGGVDSIRMTGEATNGITLNAQLQAKGLKGDYNTADEEVFVRNKKGELILELNTGKVNRKWLEYYEELAWSERILMQTQAGLVALTGEKVDYKVPGVDEFIGNRVFGFRKSKELTGFSKMPLLLTTTESERATGWLPAQPYCLYNLTSGFKTGMQAFYSLKLHYVDVSPAEVVKGVGSLVNEQGNVNYMAPISSATCVPGTAEFVNTVLIKESTFVKNNCDAGYRGTTWNITVDAGLFGGETLDEANTRALQEYNNRNTQANANLPGNGACVLLQTGLDAEYRNYSAGIANDPDAIFALAIGASRTDVHINNPQQFLPAGIANTYYAIEHNGFIKSDVTGNVVLRLKHYKGVRMWVNGILEINNWSGSGLSDCIVPMIVGKYYAIKVQYGFENTGTAEYVLEWNTGGGLMLVPAYACFR